MTRQDIIFTYLRELETIRKKGIEWYKDYIDEKTNYLPLSDLTIASSIIAVFDILEKKEKK